MQRETWPSALAGHTLDQTEQEGERKRLLLERFQEEVSFCNFGECLLHSAHLLATHRQE